MKKRNLKSLKLAKKSISNLKTNTVKGGKDTLEGVCIIGVYIGEAIYSWYYDCNEE